MCKKTCSIECHDKRTRLYRRNQLKDLLFGTTIEKMTEPKDWGNSIYFFNDIDSAEKYYKDKEHPYLITVELVQPIKYIKCTHNCFRNCSYEAHMAGIITEIEGLLRTEKPIKMPFMKWLGSLGYAFQCYHISEDDTMEIAIPKYLLTKENFILIESKDDSKVDSCKTSIL